MLKSVAFQLPRSVLVIRKTIRRSRRGPRSVPCQSPVKSWAYKVLANATRATANSVFCLTDGSCWRLLFHLHDAMRITAEIAERMLGAAEWSFGVDHPIVAKQ